MAAASALPSSPTCLSPPSGCLRSHQASVDGEGSEWPGDAGDPVRLDGGSPAISGLAQLPSARPWCPAEAPAPCAPLALPAFTLCPSTAPPTIFHLFYSPLSPFLASFQSVCPPSLCAPLPCIFLPPHPTPPSAPPSASLSPFGSFFLAFSPVCVSVCLSVPGPGLPWLPPPLPAGLSPSLPRRASSVSLSPCLSLPPAFREGSRDLRAADRASCGCGRP